MISNIMNEIWILNENLKEIQLFPVNNEKNNIYSNQLNFITSATNLRSRNYRIPESDVYKVKKTIDNTIPLLISSNSMAAGVGSIELYKLCANSEIENYKNGFFNTATNLYIFSQPKGPIYNTCKDYDPIIMAALKAYPEGFTIWNKLTVEGPCTVEDFINEIGIRHQLKVIKHPIDLKKRSLAIEISVEGLEDGFEYYTPKIKYTF